MPKAKRAHSDVAGCRMCCTFVIVPHPSYVFLSHGCVGEIVPLPDIRVRCRVETLRGIGA